jgi:hypothetical protein
LARQAKRSGKQVAVIDRAAKGFFPWAKTTLSSDLPPALKPQDIGRVTDAINLVAVSNPLAPPRHNKQLVQAVKAASDEYDLCLLLAPPIWSYQDISDLILAGKNCIVAIDMKAMKPAQISDLMCTLEVASSQPTGWILYNAPLEWVRREAAKRQVGRMDRRARAVYG